jgi:hypothetical protein
MLIPDKTKPIGQKFMTLLSVFLFLSAGLFLLGQHQEDWSKWVSQVALILLLLWFFGSYFSYYIRRYFEG